MKAICTKPKGPASEPKRHPFHVGQKASIYPAGIPTYLCKLLFLKYLAHLTFPKSLNLGLRDILTQSCDYIVELSIV